MLHTVIFDVGGTLIDAPDLMQRMSRLFLQVGNPAFVHQMISDTFLRYYRGAVFEDSGFLYVEEMIRKTLLEVSAALGFEDKSSLARELYWDVFLSNARLCSDTVETLTRLKQAGIKLVIASDADAPLLYEELRLFRLWRFFDSWVISGEIKAYKPSDLFAEALRQYISGDMSRVLFVGDSEVDILTGRKIGAHTVLKTSSKNEGILPDFEIENLTDIFVLKQFFS